LDLRLVCETKERVKATGEQDDSRRLDFGKERELNRRIPMWAPRKKLELPIILSKETQAIEKRSSDVRSRPEIGPPNRKL
jgi:hypothetical protein